MQMGLFRRAAKKVVGKVLGGSGTTPSAYPQSEPSRTPTGSSSSDDSETLANIECGPQELKERLGAGEPVVVVDVREPAETATGIIPGAILMPLGSVQDRWEELKDCNEIVCYCAAGMRSYKAAVLLRENGLFNATSLEGGIQAWSQIDGETVAPE
ncbi:MAG: rhodanese-like domain-containing protein [Myxococcota bacterium]|nr:rhodanese-like domain-containing protein [Myxococcota bacterium]